MSVYFIRNKASGSVKVGWTKGPVKRRLSQLQVGCDGELEVVGEIEGSERDEKKLHERFEALWIRGEWFRNAGELRATIEALEAPLCRIDLVAEIRGWPSSGWGSCLARSETYDGDTCMPLCLPCYRAVVCEADFTLYAMEFRVRRPRADDDYDWAEEPEERDSPTVPPPLPSVSDLVRLALSKIVKVKI